MMTRLVECVPNFSEGRNRQTIDKIVAEIQSVHGVELLDVDIGYDANRTVMTFVGEPEAVLNAAYRAIAQAADSIDMQRHHGEHPRLGATDVSPFVPLRGVDMKRCISLAHQLGQKVGDRLGIPVYLYEESATQPQRKYLFNIRRGEYEGLAEKMQKESWIPDYGPKTMNAKAGATVIGARNMLIAFNVNLNSSDAKPAREIAAQIRESGHLKRDAGGKKVLDSSGSPQRVAGKFKGCRAIGWSMTSYQRAQVSMNLIDYEHAPPHLVFDACCEFAARKGLRVTGSQLVGMIPLQALLHAGRYYLRKQGRTPAVPENKLIHVAAVSMGMNDLTAVDIKSKILDYRIDRNKPYTTLSVQGFVAQLSSSSPVPAGGSVAALCGALSTALTAMIAAITHESQIQARQQQMLIEIGERAHDLKKKFLTIINQDAVNYHRYLKSFKSKSCSVQPADLNDTNVQQIIRTPVAMLKQAKPMAMLARQMLLYGSKNMASDAATAALLARTCAQSASFTIDNNMIHVKASDHKREFMQTMHNLKNDVIQHVEETLARID